MQAIKNALHSSSSREDNTTAQSHGNTVDRDNSRVGQDNYSGSTTGDSTHTTLRNTDATSGQSGQKYQSNDGDLHRTSMGAKADNLNDRNTVPTNASATRSTGLTSSSTSDNYNTGAGRSTAGTSHLDHTTGHDHSVAAKFDPTSENVTHDHKHLNHVVHQDHRHVEVEEVERQREIDRHVHHVQHHVQPVVDKQVKPEVVHENIVPTTEIKERHQSTAEDRALLQGLTSQQRDEEVHRGKERTVVDLGEKVHENVHHHVHHVTQPVIEQEVIDRERIHTVIPVHHTTHEAPIIHKSSTHEPVSMDSFLQGGGKLSSGITHQNAGVLQTEGCDRTVEGDGERMIEKLHLGSSKSNFGSYSTGAPRTSRRPGRKVGRSGSMSSVSSSDEERGSRQQKREKKGLMQKAKEAVGAGNNNQSGQTYSSGQTNQARNY